MAQAHLSDRVRVDSAGTHDYQLRQPPDPRAVAVADRRGYPLPPRRMVSIDDFERFDMILATVQYNLDVQEEAESTPLWRIPRRATRLAWELPMREVPCPHQGEPEQFEYVPDLIERNSEGLFDAVRAGIVANRNPALPAAG